MDMQDFNEYASNQSSSNGDLQSLIKNLAQKFDGKSNAELLKAVYEEALKGKRNGTLTNAEIDKFSSMLSPFLDEKQKNVLKKIVAELKKL